MTEDLVARALQLGVELEPARATGALAWLDAMLDENRRLNLTAVRERDAALVLHVLDSLAIGRAPVDASRTLDLGSGNGFPGVGVWGAYPDAEVLLLERTQKKAAALERCLAATALDGVSVLAGDAAQVPARGLRGAFTLVTARAVGRAEDVARLALPLLARGGSLALWVADGTELPRRPPRGFAERGSVDYELSHPTPRRRRIAVYKIPA